MKKRFLFGMVLLFMQTAIWAQNATVKGRVVDENGNPVSGVSVFVKGTKTGTVTDAEGNYSLTVKDGTSPVLAFSSKGFSAQELTARSGQPLTVRLEKESANLDDVVVIGYSSVKRKDLTGSVSSVGAKQLRDIPLTNAAEALTGRLAGVQVTTTEGAPGADVQIRVRGGGSITQDNSPIYIVDGIQVENALNLISPQDIQNVDVLKDAAATAIYGARGANGVVIITTKSGKAGKTSVSYNGSFGFRQITGTMDVLNPYDFVTWQYERARLNNDTTFNRTYGSTWDTLNVYKDIPMINWQEEVFGRKARYQNHNVSVNGGNQSTRFNLSLTANLEDGIQLESGFDRYLANFKIDHKASDKFSIGFTARYIDQRIRGAGTTNSGTRQTNRLRHTIQYRPFEIPTAPESDEFDEEYFIRSAFIINPVILTQAEYRRAYTNGINMSANIAYKIWKNLTFRSVLGYDNTNVRTDLFFSKITPTARNFGQQPVASITQQQNNTLNNSNTLQWTQLKMGGHHDLDVIVGQEIFETKSRLSTMETRYFPADISPEKALANMGLGAAPSGVIQPRPITNVTPPNRILSFFGRVNYAYDDKYLASFSLRADRSSKFKYENGTLLFPAASFAWRFSKESFVESASWLSDGKLRFGYGSAGNNRIGDLLYQQLYGVTGEYALNHNPVPGFAPTALANENLRWEKTITRNIGLDLSFFKSRLNLTVDWYKNEGRDLLLSVAIPPTTGYSSQLQNLGSTSNRGVEIQINAVPVQTKTFMWTSNFNIAFNRNRVENLGGITQQTRNSGWQGSDGADDYLVKVGEPIGLMYGFINDGWYTVDDFDYNSTTGVYTLKTGVPNSQNISGTIRPGAMKIRDINGDGLITTDGDRTVIGNANPDFIGGWNNQFSFHNFDLSLFFNFVVGNDIYNANRIEWTDGSFPNLNTLATVRDRWTNINAQGQLVTDPKELTALNANAKIWTPVNSNRYFLHSAVVEDGSFLRLNNLTLGYSLPTPVIKRMKISQFRVYGTVNNLFTVTNYSGYDPEVTARRNDPLTPGVDFAAYPRARVWVFGLNVTF
jgi:TonB-dependent starch-binding outer membrane protein SusC